MQIDLKQREEFASRHLGPNKTQVAEMLDVLGLQSLDQLIDDTIPQAIRKKNPLQLPEAKGEYKFINDFKSLMGKNKLCKNYIGMGYYNCIVPSVIQRNILENPSWYTAYTPYQAEIAQGRLEALINFQTTVIELTGMEIANASLLDEATAAAEAMSMLYSLRKGAKKKANRFLVDKNTFPQTLAVLQTRAVPIGISLEIIDIEKVDISAPDLFGIFVQNPDGNGSVRDFTYLLAAAKENQVFSVMATDLLSLTLLKAPGEMGADVAVGTSQRFGVPLGYGGPHAAFFATKEDFKRQIPGRIIGVSVDRKGRKAYRMALQTREQHIRREKATSNICTAQVLLAVMAGMYAVYHGPEGLKKIAARVNGFAHLLAEKLSKLGFEQLNQHYFDTLKVELNIEKQDSLRQLAETGKINFRYFEDGSVGISLDETTTIQDIEDILQVFIQLAKKNDTIKLQATLQTLDFPQHLTRSSTYLQHPVFQNFHSEHELLRYMKKLENKDLSLVHSMISLGSCTMKLNATSEMLPISWPEVAHMHPFAPLDQAEGYQEMIKNLEDWLNEITGFAATSFQPNSGAQGEFTGLMVIRAYHQSRGEVHRNVALIPSSAHGTNPASAVMAGMKVVIVQCDDQGNIDLEDLKAKSAQYKDNLASLMVTYPSTHGVFEEDIISICETIHENGGQVYMDGANMNAQVGLTNPAIIGADVCHLNLHKTFCIPHGGGGPGMGPICVAAHLKPFLPVNPLNKTNNEDAVSAAIWGSASILPISYAYIAMMGAEGLTDATKYAILNANYIREKVKDYFPVLYSNAKGRNAHEMIIDCRDFRNVGIEVEDIAKRLMDYGFHAPTVSFPVAGTMMIEPTESETKEELDRFCEALISIRKEIEEIELGEVDSSNNVLKNAPHTAEMALSDEWEYPYTRQRAVYPLAYVKDKKFWPAVARIDSAYGDRNLICSCIPVEEYASPEPAEI